MTLSGHGQSGPEGAGRRLKKAPASATVRRRLPRKTPAGADAAAATEMTLGEAQNREQKIAETAYFRAQQRNFESGRDLDDWLAAELEIDSLRPAHPESIDDPNIIGTIP